MLSARSQIPTLILPQPTGPRLYTGGDASVQYIRDSLYRSVPYAVRIYLWFTVSNVSIADDQYFKEIVGIFQGLC